MNELNESRLSWMRARGIRSAKFTGNGDLCEVELFPEIGAPPVDDLSLPEDEETKPPGICIHPKCGEKNGWQFARDYCRTHGLAAAGVSGAR